MMWLGMEEFTAAGLGWTGGGQVEGGVAGSRNSPPPWNGVRSGTGVRRDAAAGDRGRGLGMVTGSLQVSLAMMMWAFHMYYLTHLHKNPMREVVLLEPFEEHENLLMEKLSSLPQVIYLSGRARIWTSTIQP